MKNNLWKPFALTLCVVVMLLALFHMPRTSIGGHELRRVNMLSDVQKLDEEGRVIAEVHADSADGIVIQEFDSAATKVETTLYIDSIPEGMTAIEDFAADGSARVMDHFYAALDSASKRPVRIAYYGDSFIEGDILTAELRNLLQTSYGGCGVGFVDIASITSGFRQTVRAKDSGWTSHLANDKSGFNKSFQGINAKYFIPSSRAQLELNCQTKVYGSNLGKAKQATIYFTPGEGLTLSAAINKEDATVVYAGSGTPEMHETTHTVSEEVVRTEVIPGDSAHGIPEHIDTIRETVQHQVHSSVAVQHQGSIHTRTITGDITSLSLNVQNGCASRFYGVALDGHQGIALDNHSLRGSNGCFLAYIPESTLTAFAKIRPYDLIVIHFGLNIADKKRKDYSAYTKRMSDAIEHIHKAYPNASILVVSMSDRDERRADGTLRTMPGVKELVSYQRKMASDTNVAFWNLWEAMGGDGSLARMTAKKQANLDYTHINFAGGRHIAKLLFDVLMNGKENYDRRK